VAGAGGQASLLFSWGGSTRSRDGVSRGGVGRLTREFPDWVAVMPGRTGAGTGVF